MLCSLCGESLSGTLLFQLLRQLLLLARTPTPAPPPTVPRASVSLINFTVWFNNTAAFNRWRRGGGQHYFTEKVQKRHMIETKKKSSVTQNLTSTQMPSTYKPNKYTCRSIESDLKLNQQPGHFDSGINWSVPGCCSKL